ncbi:MAG: type II toxin-antitoxin system HipA family toxin [Microbacteriaceae bacterium]|nr:type II toxin-antitoxin system HipA family toxin [Microbacteriaceae bacterium]
MAFVPALVVEVRAWGGTVGAVARDSRGDLAFEFDPGWVTRGREISPLSMPLAVRRVYSFPRLSELTWYGLPPAIADSLPDRFGNAIIDAEFARRGASPGEATALDRLVYTGSRAMGALEFLPDGGPEVQPPTTLEVGELVAVARDVIAGRFGDETESTTALEQLLAIGTSAGGARAKAVVAIDPASNEVRPGQTPQPGMEDWLLKFDGVGADHELGTTAHYGRIEYAYSLMARAAGIEMTPTRLLQEGGRAHFMTRRFDRPGGTRRLHVQTLCALSMLDYNLRGSHDYAQLFQAIDALELGDDSREQAFRRMVFNWMAANCDDHTKNHAFVMDEDGRWSLAPAYDLTHAFNPQGEWTYQHLMSVGGKFRDLTSRDLAEFAERHGVQGYRRMIDEVAGAVESWPEHAAAAGVPRAAADRIRQDFTVAQLIR